jgi:hypothetical protein
MGGDQTSSEEEAHSGKFDGSTPAYIRRDFIRKVYSILIMQLAATLLIAVLFQNVSDEWLRTPQAYWLFEVSKWGSLAIILGMVCCCQTAARTFPTNFILLASFTVLEAILIGFVTRFYETESVVLALGITVGVFLGLTAYACLTKTDFTGLGPYLFAVLIALCCFGIFLTLGQWLFGLNMPFLHKVYAAIGALLFSVYIVYDTQMIVGGRHKKHEFGVDEYIFAALNLYLDIVNLFLFLLSLFGDRR